MSMSATTPRILGPSIDGDVLIDSGDDWLEGVLTWEQFDLHPAEVAKRVVKDLLS